MKSKGGGMIRKTAIIFILKFLFLFLFPILVLADEYRWIEVPNRDDEQHTIDVDPNICKLYEENLQYFARRNTLLSCYRPIAPHLKNRIKEVEWEDLDPNKYPDLFRAIVVKYRYLDLQKKSEEEIQKSVKYNLAQVEKKIMVFRRARLSLTGHIRVGNPGAAPEAYWIVQFGFNNSQDNPDEFYRCTPTRGGIPSQLERTLHLYVVSEAKKEVTKKLFTGPRPSTEGQSLRLIDGRLFIENINQQAAIELNEVNTNMPLADTVCRFIFKKSLK